MLYKRVNKSISITELSLETYLHYQKERFGKPYRYGCVPFAILLLAVGAGWWEIGQEGRKAYKQILRHKKLYIFWHLPHSKAQVATLVEHLRYIMVF